MSYSAIEKMRIINLETFGAEADFPLQPEPHFDVDNSEVKDLALRFLHNSCEDLGIDYESGSDERLNMQRDVDRLCLECALEHFMESGASEDAFILRYCFAELFYGKDLQAKKEIISRGIDQSAVLEFAKALAEFEAAEGLNDDIGRMTASEFLEYSGRKTVTLDSGENMMQLYKLAVLLNARYLDEEDIWSFDKSEAEFHELPLEYQMFNLTQAASILKQLQGQEPEEGKAENLDLKELGASEHERWVRERSDMAWAGGDLYETIDLPGEFAEKYPDEQSARRDLRELFRMHKYAMNGEPSREEIHEHYMNLPDDEKEKDVKPYKYIQELL